MIKGEGNMKKNLQILVVDDDKIDRMAIKRYFKSNPRYQITFVSSKEEGIEKARQFLFDLIIDRRVAIKKPEF